MLIHFWGTRGSLPYSVRTEEIREKIRLSLCHALEHGLSRKEEIDAFIDNNLPFSVKYGFGCNTPCVEIRGGPDFVICDAGTGLRDFGNYVMQHFTPPRVFHIFMSHLHWDHIQGFPFFIPAFVQGNTVHFYGAHSELESAFMKQQEAPCFPVPMSYMQADIQFHLLDPMETHKISDFNVNLVKQNHPGDSYGYSFCKDGRKFVYSTDAEHTEASDKDDYYFINFAENADLLVFDAQYRLVEHFHTKEGWGHSSNMTAVELAVRSKVKQLCLFHNEHTVDDNQLMGFLEQTRRYLELYAPKSPLSIDMAFDDLEVKL